MATTLVGPDENMLLRQMQHELAATLEPGGYDATRAANLQRALADVQERANRYRRMRRAALTVAEQRAGWLS